MAWMCLIRMLACTIVRSSFASLLGSIIDVSPESDLEDTQTNPNDSSIPDEQGSVYRALDTIVQWIFASRFVHFPTSATSSVAKKRASESTTTTSLATMFSLLFSSSDPATMLQQQLQQQLETTYTGVSIHVFVDKKQVKTCLNQHIQRQNGCTNARESFLVDV